MTHATEINTGKRFEFGKNWTAFLSILDEERIQQAELSLQKSLKLTSLQGLSFLDIGSGSGLFSLAAHNLGARVHSFDYDPKSVACTQELRRRYASNDTNWNVESGSILDANFIGQLGQFDIVYSWGVLHHTGSMYLALDQAASLVKPNGRLFISIYNHQGYRSRLWKAVKRLYCKNIWTRSLVRCIYYPYFILERFKTDLIYRKNPIKSYHAYKKNRGMSVFHDWEDWLGGHPFEVAKPEEIFTHFRDLGFSLEHLKTCGGGLGCNEFIFRRL